MQADPAGWPPLWTPLCSGHWAAAPRTKALSNRGLTIPLVTAVAYGDDVINGGKDTELKKNHRIIASHEYYKVWIGIGKQWWQHLGWKVEKIYAWLWGVYYIKDIIHTRLRDILLREYNSWHKILLFYIWGIIPYGILWCKHFVMITKNNRVRGA